MLYQKTVIRDVIIDGIGLHSGKKVKMRILPAVPNSGIQFKRIDITNNNIIIPSVFNVTNATLCTTISNEYGVKVHTIEHLMAALFGLGIDNAMIEVDNNELPILDGSAKVFIEKIKSGEINFEKLICTPAMMIKLSKLGKVLGPKGLMPNPKLGSVTDDLKTAITNAKSGQAEIRNDKDGNIGVSIGKKSFSDDKLIKNFNAIVETLDKEKSNNTVKGDLIKSAFVTSTMGVSYRLKLGKSI